MKTHLRLIYRTGHAPQFRVACGTMKAQWTRDTTSDAAKVDCKRCLAKAAALDRACSNLMQMP